MKKQRSASPSQAMPRSAPSARTRATMSRRFSSISGSAGWLGKVPSRSKYMRTVSTGRWPKIASAPTAPMPFAGVEDHLEPGDEPRRRRRTGSGARSPRRTVAEPRAPGGRGRVGVAPGHQPLADLLDARVAGEGERPAPHQLDPVPLLRVVGGGDDGAAVEVVAGHVVVQHVGADDADVGHLRALRARALDEARRRARGRTAGSRGRPRSGARRGSRRRRARCAARPRRASWAG